MCYNQKVSFPHSDCRLGGSHSLSSYSELCFIFIVQWVVPSTIIYYLLMTEWFVSFWAFPWFSLLNLIGNIPAKYFFFLQICWFYNIYMSWRTEVAFFSPTFGRVGFSSQTETYIFRFCLGGVSRQAKYLSNGDPDCTIGGAYKVMVHIGEGSFSFWSYWGLTGVTGSLWAPQRNHLLPCHFSSAQTKS